MSKKYIPPLPDKMPPKIPAHIEDAEQVYEEHLVNFHQVFTDPEFLELIAHLNSSNNAEATGNYWIDRYRAAQYLKDQAVKTNDANAAQIADAPLWEIAAAIETQLHMCGVSSAQRLANPIHLN